MSNPEQPPREEGAGETLRPDAEVLPTSTEIKDAEREEQQAEHARSAEERNRLGEELTTTPIAENVPRQEEVTRENTTEETSNETPNEPPGIFRRSINKLKEKFNNSKASVKNFFKTFSG